MACNDITYIGTQGQLSRFRDTYTRDHSTPLDDTIYGGTDGLTAAVAIEDPATNSIIALYRKKLIGEFTICAPEISGNFDVKIEWRNFHLVLLFLVASDPSDVSVDGPMHVIWSMGQDPFDPLSSPPPAASALVNGSFTNAEILRQFPRKGDFNSHNHNPKSRGSWEVNLRTGESWTQAKPLVSHAHWPKYSRVHNL